MKKKTKTLLLISIQCECAICDKLVKYVKFEAENNIYSMKYFVTLFFALHFLSSFFGNNRFSGLDLEIAFILGTGV